MAKPKRNPDDKAQKKRFIEKARELGADESGEAFERAFERIVPPKREKSTGHIETARQKHDQNTDDPAG